MSGIFGLCAFDQRPVAPKSLNAIKAAMSSWGPDGCHSWRQDNAALGHALLMVAPPSRSEVMPLHDPDRKQVLVAAARLDNRDELCDSFGIPSPERPSTPDGRLIQLAYERWGEGCPKKLYGDWSFAVWDYGRQRLFLARDQLGSSGLFYYHQPPFLRLCFQPASPAGPAGGAPEAERDAFSLLSYRIFRSLRSRHCLAGGSATVARLQGRSHL